MIKTGFSLYLGSSYQKNKEVIEKAVKANMSYVFTSLHIPEEKVDDYPSEVKKLMELCKLHNLNVMVDVSNNTLPKLGLDNLSQLKEWGFTHLRIDFGISLEEIAELTNDFGIVLNASTVTLEELNKLRELGVDFTKFLACHNFYPKPLTGISLQQMIDRNRMFKSFNIDTMGFVAGDKDLRGPVFSGLPTLENHRHVPVLESTLSCYHDGLCDVVCIGDIDCQDETYRQLKLISEDVIEVRVKINNQDYQYLNNTIHQDRVDYSEHFFRSVQSRQSFFETSKFNPIDRGVGSVCVSNNEYGRYEGELEIMRMSHKKDDRVNVIGQVIEEDLELFLLGSKSHKLKLLLV